MGDLPLTKGQMSMVYSAFALAYAAFEIPTAWWADRRGTRHVLTRIVLWWSGFTMLTAAALNFTSLLVTRFLFGMGEAGAWPCVARTFSRWIPRSERGTVQGIFFTGAHLAGGVTPLLVVWPDADVRELADGFRAVRLVGVVWAAAGIAGSATIRRASRGQCGGAGADRRRTRAARRPSRRLGVLEAAARPTATRCRSA